MRSEPGLAASFRLPDESATLLAGRLLAESLPSEGPYPAILLRGDLGAGKTTLVRGLMEALPGGESAEVSSPSFNIVNYYPSTPEVAHFDLYRLEHQPPDDELLEAFEEGNLLTVVEWVQYLHERRWPENRLELTLNRSGDGRQLTVACGGSLEFGERLATALGRHFEKS